MAIALETVVKQLTDSGIIAPGKLENFVPPKATPQDGETLLRELFKQGLLTKFQAQQFAQGRDKALILGNYTILDKIGAGGMGQVFKAHHRRMERVVAIKMLPKAMLKDVAAAARFQREVVAAAKLSHPNIVAAHDADESNGVHFLVMEYVEGSDLSALVKKNGPLPVAKAVNYIIQAAKGLEFAHKKGVIHRDIKPANLLLDNEGTVKILDMGLARISSDGNAATQAELTGTGAVMGTVDYMSPEQALNTKHADARADIYSLGCSLYYLLTGKPTYDCDTVTAKLIAHQFQPIPEIRKVRDDVPDRLETIFAKMVAKKIEDRYQTMTEVIGELERCQGGLSSSSPSATVKTSSSPDAHTSDITAAFGNRLLQSIPLPEPEREPDRGSPPRKNMKLLASAGAAGFLCLLLGVIVIFRNQKGEEVGRMELPDGTSVEVQASGKSPDAKPITTFKEPAFQVWVKDVAAMPAEQQIEAVSKKLMELNPGFDGKVTGIDGGFYGEGKGAPKIEGGIVTELRLFTDNVTDLSPVRAMAGLKVLHCPGSSAYKGKLFDLSPLQGLPLTSLNCGWTDATDLLPLQGMKLTKLSCFRTKVSSLLPLQGMPLVELGCGHTQISNLNPLKGIKLTKLELEETAVSDLTPIQDCTSLSLLQIKRTKVTPDSVAALQKALPNCKIEWDDPAKTTTTQPNKPWNTPAFEQWMKDVQAMPAEEQVKAVSKKLMELNPGFDGKVTGYDENKPPRIENGVVIELGFLTDNVTDISPVRALAGLKGLGCQGIPSEIRKGRLSDLSPLAGMKLTSLMCGRSKVSDLSPLKGMALDILNCDSSQVSDLSPLKGMPLRTLHCLNTQVSDLSPVGGMPLRNLNVNSTNVSSLSALKGISLASLKCARTPVSDLSPLETCKSLTTLNVTGTKVTPAGVSALQKALPNCKIEWDEPAKSATTQPWNTPAFQQWMKDVQAMPAEEQVKAVSKKLVELNPGFDGKLESSNQDPNRTPKVENGVVTELGIVTDSVKDISPVRALIGLRSLNCSGSVRSKGKLSELSPLQGMKLTTLRCDHTEVSDLTPLAGMPLIDLGCICTNVSDLSPLAGMSLKDLGIVETKVFDLSPLRGMPLADLRCGGTPVSDLSPLQGMPLTFLECFNTPVSDLSPLRGMPLQDLKCRDTKVSDLSPLLECNALTMLSLRRTKVTPATVATLQKASPNCKIDWDDPAKSATTQPNQPWNTPAFQAWVKKVQAMPAEEQIKAVSKKLVELNPGFDGVLKDGYGKGTPKIEDGVVTELVFVTDKATDISPVRVLSGLKVLKCHGSDFKGILTDISPLQGMQVTTLDLTGNRNLTDISPLKDMPLTDLILWATNCSDLSPLKGMRLTTVNLRGIPGLKDLTPLQGMPLVVLDCVEAKLTDLTPLQGMKLTSLKITKTKIADLAPLRGAPLDFLEATETPISDLSPLKGMPLTHLELTKCPNVSDLSPLEACKGLKVVQIKTTKVTPAQVAALQKALPNCKIEWDDPAKPTTPEPAASRLK